MAKRRITEDQVKQILQEVANGAKPGVLAKKHGFSLGTYYNWKNKIGIPKPDGDAPAASAAPAKKVAAKKPTVKKAVAEKAPATIAVAKEAPVRKTAVKKAPVKKRAGRADASSESKLQAEIAKGQKQIAKLEGQIITLKVRYTDAILKSVK